MNSNDSNDSYSGYLVYMEEANGMGDYQMCWTLTEAQELAALETGHANPETSFAEDPEQMVKCYIFEANDYGDYNDDPIDCWLRGVARKQASKKRRAVAR